jgi:uncharacterized protein (AIM24 family)
MIAHRLVSAGQLVVVQLDSGQAVWCQPGRFVWKTPNVAVQARLIGAGGEAGGLFDRALATAITAGRRRLAGRDAALPYFSAGASSGLVAFAGEPAGEVRELRLEPGRSWLVTRTALVAAESTVGIGPAAAAGAGERPGAGGRPGAAAQVSLERLAGTGSAFVTGVGGLVELDLARYGGAVDVDPGRLVAIQEGVEIAPRRRSLAGDELLAVLLGGGRPSLASLNGSGTVLLQSAAALPKAPGKPPNHEQGGSDGIPG